MGNPKLFHVVRIMTCKEIHQCRLRLVLRSTMAATLAFLLLSQDSALEQRMHALYHRVPHCGFTTGSAVRRLGGLSRLSGNNPDRRWFARASRLRSIVRRNKFAIALLFLTDLAVVPSPCNFGPKPSLLATRPSRLSYADLALYTCRLGLGLGGSQLLVVMHLLRTCARSQLVV